MTTSQTQKLDVSGKGAIVTGGGSGINLAFVKELYNAGCNVLIADIKLHKSANEWLDTLPNSNGGSPRIIFQETDVTKWSDLEQVFDVYQQKFGGAPYIVCPGAGLYEPSTNSFWGDEEKDDHYKLFMVNLHHPVKMTRIAIRRMLAANAPGIIIHVSSTGAQKASIVTPLYQPTKHAISCFVRSMEPLYKLTGIRVVAVAPGPTGSPMLYESEKASKFIDPDKDVLATPEQIAAGMMAVATDLKYPQSTVLEVTGPGPKKWREVMMLNDPGPDPAAFFSRKDEAIKDVVAILDEDRRGNKA